MTYRLGLFDTWVEIVSSLGWGRCNLPVRTGGWTVSPDGCS